MTGTIAWLRERIEELEAELNYRDEVIAQLTVHEPVFPLDWRLSFTETRILACLARKGGAASMEALITAVYWRRDEPERPEEVVKITVCKMRHKLRPFAIEIPVITGVGYGIDRRTALRLRAILAGGADPLERRLKKARKPARTAADRVLPLLALMQEGAGSAAKSAA